MSADAPLPPSKREALEEAGQAIREAQSPDRDELLEAQRALRRAERAHDQVIREAQRALAAARRAQARAAEDQRRRADVEAAEQRLAEATADRSGVEESWPLVRRLAGHVEDEESVLDLAPGISAGHDGVVVATDRRFLFLAPRRTLAFDYEEIRGVAARGRWFGSNLAVSTASEKVVISGLSLARAKAMSELIGRRAGAEGGLRTHLTTP